MRPSRFSLRAMVLWHLSPKKALDRRRGSCVGSEATRLDEFLNKKEYLTLKIYVNMEHLLCSEVCDEYHVKVASYIAEASKLIELGFDYVT